MAVAPFLAGREQKDAAGYETKITTMTTKKKLDRILFRGRYTFCTDTLYRMSGLEGDTTRSRFVTTIQGRNLRGDFLGIRTCNVVFIH